MKTRLLILLTVGAVLLGGCSAAKTLPADAPPPAATTTVTTAAERSAALPALVGTWNASLDYAPSLQAMGVDVEDCTIDILCTFYEDGSYRFQAENDDFYQPLRDNLDALIEALIDLNGQSLTVEEYLESEGLTRDAFVVFFTEQAGLASSLSAVYGLYRVDGDKLILDDEEAAYSYDGTALTVESRDITVVFTPFDGVVPTPVTTTAVPPATTTTAIPVADTETAILGTWQGHYSMNGMLGFQTTNTLMQTVTYTFREDGSFTGTAGVSDDNITAFIDAVLTEHGKTCEEMFSADRNTVIEEIKLITTGVIDNGSYTVANNSITMTTDEYVFLGVLNGGILTVDDGGLAYPCTKIEP